MWSSRPDRSAFPINGVRGLLELFKDQVAKEPDLALLSIVVGAIENSLTESKTIQSDNHGAKLVKVGFPQITYEEVRSLYDKFVTIVKGALGNDVKTKAAQHATRNLVKKVSDVIWNSLTRSYYKDRAHLQSLYSYLTGRKLDCFGVAFAVVAACQVLGYSDVHLALSEDHAWVIFGPDGTETAEVTWHGKGNEDKRGQPIGPGSIITSWLYVAGYPVICNRHIEVAALVSSINPSLNSTTDVYEVALMQQHLLWFLYDQGHLNLYPMALGNLGELEEVSRFDDGKARPDALDLFRESIECARKNYSNKHVYPYTYQGGYYFRNKMYKEAFSSWADAGDVIRSYNYSRDDEEIYKEFLEIANESIPQIMKIESSGHSARSILKDPQCFAHLLRFYDGICKWEEESQTPILHIGWAKPLVSTISKFEADVRAQVNIICYDETTNPVLTTMIDPKVEGDVGDVKVNIDLINSSNNNSDDGTKDIKKGEKNIKTESMKEQLNSSNDQKDLDKSNSESKFSTHHQEIIVKELSEEMEEVANSHPTTILYSHKMKGLKNLLLAEKLNTHAISLHLTAQSQVFISKKQKVGSDATEQNAHCSIRPKRIRRE